MVARCRRPRRSSTCHFGFYSIEGQVPMAAMIVFWLALAVALAQGTVPR